MASSLNLLVLRLAQFHSENGLGGISSLLGRNEEELIAAAIAEHRASIHIQHRQRLQSLNHNMVDQKKIIASLVSMKSHSWWSRSSSSCSSVSYESKFDAFQTGDWTLARNCMCKRRKRRHWHLRRSPQNIKHLLYFDYPRPFYGRKSFLNHDHQLRTHEQQLMKRISI